ncbi:hypothetical protein J6590_059381 [Homalodisca vitripennis]|nr:hypothetical protein J6590_059381 [Homalodisca vitripennis]
MGGPSVERHREKGTTENAGGGRGDLERQTKVEEAVYDDPGELEILSNRPPANEVLSEQTTMSPDHGTRPQTEKRQTPIRPNVAQKQKSEKLDNVLIAVRDHFKKPPSQDDCYGLMGKSVEMRIRAIEKRQHLIIQKRINYIIFKKKWECSIRRQQTRTT